MPYDEWETEPTPGWEVAFQVVRCLAWVPVRVEGRWRWPLTPHYALQAMYLNEHPPSCWLTVRRAMDPEALTQHVTDRHERERNRHEGRHCLGPY